MRSKDVLSILLTLTLITQVLYLNTSQNIGHSLPMSYSVFDDLSSASSDLIIEIEKNSSAIGPHSNIEFNVNLRNNISSSIYNITASLNYSNDIKVSGENPIFSTSSIEPESSVDFTFIAEFIGTAEFKSVDVILMIDGSGSMGDEINSVKRELNNLTATLSSNIPGIRMGAIVYGAEKYSEYPMSNENNYVELTSDLNIIHAFINSLYASGTHEPWGDALYLANTWDWRDDASKLIIMVGDEDCDPGIIIGQEMLKNDPTGFYNGTDLLNIVTELKDKNVIINTVICGGADNTAINQFQWIANYTKGTSVFLPELQEQGINLPEIIQEWTLEMGRELYQEITLDVTWQDYDGQYYTNSIKEPYWLDFTPPSIMISNTIKPTKPGLFSVTFIAEVSDISAISYVTLYHNAFGSWQFVYIPRIENTNLFKVELDDIPKGTNLSYFFESSDVLNNLIQTNLSWLLVEPKIDRLGELVNTWVEENDTLFSYFTAPTSNEFFLILKGPSQIDSVQLSLVDLLSNLTQHPVSVKYVNISETTARKFFKFEFQENRNYSVKFFIPSNSINYSFSYTWIRFQSPDENNQYTGKMTDLVRVHGVKWTANNGTYFYFKLIPGSPLTLVGEVYTVGDLEYVASFKILEAADVQSNDSYYILIWAKLRTGDFTLINNDTLPPAIYDPYYTADHGYNSPFPNLVYITSFIIALTLTRQRRKKQWR